MLCKVLENYILVCNAQYINIHMKWIKTIWELAYECKGPRLHEVSLDMYLIILESFKLN